MRKSIVSFFTLVLIFVPVFAFAQNVNVDDVIDTNTEIVNINTVSEELTYEMISDVQKEIENLVDDPGLLPDSPFYFLKEWGEDIHTFLTFDEEKKAELEYRYALRKMVEVQKMIEKGDGEKAREHLTKAEEKLENVRVRLEGDFKNGKDVDALVEKLELIQARQQEVLLDVYDQAPDVAKDSILKAMEHSAGGISNAIEKVKGSDEVERYRAEIEKQIENHGDEMRLRVKTQFNGVNTEIQIEKQVDDVD